MNYQETVNYLFEKLPMFSRQGAMAYKKDLGNIQALCELMGNPQNAIKTLHIAGTNGKGSVCHYLASCLQENNLKIGLYTSPHITDFTERVKINGQNMAKEWMCFFVEKYQEAIEQIQPSFFEITVAMAFKYFEEQKVDYAVIETGLGGRLDSTNIIQPIFSIITNISEDHTDLLGHSLEEIAFEKAGIIKENRPIIISESQEEVKRVFEKQANTKHAEIFFADKIWQEQVLENEILIIDSKNKTELKINFPIAHYQIKNLKAVCMALQLFSTIEKKLDWNKNLLGIKNVAKNTALRGRFDIQQLQPLIIYDVAHNAAGLKVTFNELAKNKFDKLFIICGFVKDKDVTKVLRLFPTSAYYFFSQANIPRALDAKLLYELAVQNKLQGEIESDVRKALKKAKEKAGIKDCILVIGSFFILEDLYN